MTDFWQELNWFAVQSKPHAEALAAAHVARLDLEILLPKCRQHRPVGGVSRVVTTPLFPGYFFARFSPASAVAAIRGSPGVLRVVGTSQTPVPIAPEVVHSLRERVAADGFVRLEPRGLQRGERVQIEAGPFTGWMGRVERETDGHRRVLILLEALQQARVWVEASCVEPLTPPP
jgi:transcriptional antiterminator RfaH